MDNFDTDWDIDDDGGLDFDSLGDDADDSLEQGDDSTSDFEGQEPLKDPQEKSDTAKTAAMIIALGAVVIIVALLAWRVIQSGSKEESNSNKHTQYSQQEQQNKANSQQQIVAVPNQSNTASTTNTTDNWVEFDGDTEEIQFSSQYTTAQFTITKVKHYVSVQSQDSDYIQVKTRLTGQISGYPGIYTIEVPYQLGKGLQANSRAFDVQILTGTYKGLTVIGDIRYY